MTEQSCQKITFLSKISPFIKDMLVYFFVNVFPDLFFLNCCKIVAKQKKHLFFFQNLERSIKFTWIVTPNFDRDI